MVVSLAFLSTKLVFSNTQSKTLVSVFVSIFVFYLF